MSSSPSHLLLTLFFLMGQATAASATTGAQQAPTCPELLAQAVERLKSIQYDDAEQLYELAAKDEACRLEAKLGLAEIGNRTGKRRQALQAAREILASTTDPALQAEAELQIGNSFYRRGTSWNSNRREAEAAFLRAVELSEGRHAGAVGRLKKLYAEVGEQEKLAELEQRFPGIGVLTPAETADLLHQPLAARSESAHGPSLPIPAPEPLQPPPGWPDLRAPRPPDHDCRYAGDGPPPAVIRVPERIYDPQPQYTEKARQARIQGVVIIYTVINEQGLVADLAIAKSLDPWLDEAVMKAIRTWRFKPATAGDGKPVPCYYMLTTNFRLQ